MVLDEGKAGQVLAGGLVSELAWDHGEGGWGQVLAHHREDGVLWYTFHGRYYVPVTAEWARCWSGAGRVRS